MSFGNHNVPEASQQGTAEVREEQAIGHQDREDGEVERDRCDDKRSEGNLLVTK